MQTKGTSETDEKRLIARAAGIMSIATLCSRILGYVKDMIIAKFFGATGVADTFFVAFRIPNLLRELFAEGSMSSAFIPVLTEYQTKRGVEEAKRLVRITFTFILIFVGSICIIGIIFTPSIVTVIAPGFISMPEKFSLTVFLTRVMFPFLFFISLAALVMGALNTKRVFFIPSLAPAMLNITIIIIVISFTPAMEQPILAVAAGVALGGFIQLAFQLPSFFKNGYSLKPEFDFRHPGLKKMSILIMPATMGMAVAQINIFISTILASYLSEGSITYLYYSMRLIQFPIGIFGVAMGMAILPTLSQHAVKGDLEKLRGDFSFALRLLFFITVPAMAGLIALREPIVNILFQRGKFDYAATIGTAQALLFYSMGIWSIVGVRVITASFYSLQDTKTPVKVAVISLAANVLFSVILMNPLQHSGLALANALASFVNFSLLFFFFKKKLKAVDASRIFWSFVKAGVASFIMAVIGWMLLHGEIWQISGATINKALYLSGTIVLCVAVYFFCSYLMKSEEFFYVLEMLKERFKK
ncbi:MAG: murein biosynthesis integral membrane protein MurJ [Nitrospirae bacterium]|jgi:putative peptidoglycan lipid II flippase|nr:murein biosynthesis integral membrane protein MurJ [Nitrospirota bacterium]